MTGSAPCRRLRGAHLLKLVTWVGNATIEYDGVGGGHPDQQEEGTVGNEVFPLEVDGAADGQHSCGSCSLTALLIHLQFAE